MKTPKKKEMEPSLKKNIPREKKSIQGNESRSRDFLENGFPKILWPVQQQNK